MKKFLLVVGLVSFGTALSAGWQDKGAYQKKYSPRQFKQPQMFYNKQATSFVSKKQMHHFVKAQKQKIESSAPEQVTRWEPRLCGIKDPAVICLVGFLFLSATARAYQEIHCPPKHAVQLPSAQEIARRIGAAGFKRFAYMSDLPKMLGNKKVKGCELWNAFTNAKYPYVKKFESSPVYSLRMSYCEWLALLFIPEDTIIPAILGKARKPRQERSVARFLKDKHHSFWCSHLKTTGQY